MLNEGEKLGEFYRIQKSKYERCLFPEHDCSEKPIRAHSIQKNGGLSKIAENGHVVGINMKIENKSPKSRFQSMGINEASTFSGLCSKHDNELFKPIDDCEIDLDDQEQLFLLAYRSITRELHAVLKAASQLVTANRRQIERKEAASDGSDFSGHETLQHMLKAYGTYNLRQEFFDPILKSQKFREVKHSKFIFQHPKPFLTASTFFSADLKPWGEPFAGVLLNIVPLNEAKTAVIFSYSTKHSSTARKYLRPIFTSNGQKRLYELSHLIIDRVENFFLRPSVFEQWHKDKIEFLENEYHRTVLGGSPVRSMELSLFSKDVIC